MKKRVVRFLCAVLMIALFLPILREDAHAASWSFDQYQWQYYVLHSGEYEPAIDIWITEGEIPTGMSVLIDEEQNVIFAGSATDWGEYYFVVRVNCNGGESYYYDVTAKINRLDLPEDRPVGAPNVTKNPTSETTNVGGSVTFVARATDTDVYTWILTNGSEMYECQYAPNVFDGIRVLGQGTQTLTLSNVPQSLDGWQIYCAFNGPGGDASSGCAVITVLSNETQQTEPTQESLIQPPRIVRQPEGLTLAKGEAGTLGVEIDAPPGAEIHYQWYRLPGGDTENRQTVSGGTGAKLTVRAKKENDVYFVTVWYEAENGVSETVTSNNAVVKLERKEAAASVSPTQGAKPSESKTAPPKREQAKTKTSPILWIAAAVVAFVGVGAIVFALCRNRGKKPIPQPRPPVSQTAEQKDSALALSGVLNATPMDAADADLWFCTECGTKNHGNFCEACGAKRHGKHCVHCKGCGWQSDDPDQMPKFCPNCGKPLEEE